MVNIFFCTYLRSVLSLSSSQITITQSTNASTWHTKLSDLFSNDSCQCRWGIFLHTCSTMFKKSKKQWTIPLEKIFHPPFSQREQLAANAALAALANQHRMPSSSPPTLVLPTVQGKKRSMIEINHLLSLNRWSRCECRRYGWWNRTRRESKSSTEYYEWNKQ